MDAPKPKEEKSKEIYTIKSDKNNTFSLCIKNLYSSIFISASYEGEIQKKEYEKSFSLDDLKNNKYLSILESIDEIFEEIINIIKQKLKEVKIIEETNQIILSIPLGGYKIKEILLCLNEKVKNEKEQLNDLYNIIYNLKKENNDLKFNQQKLEERIKYLESFINDIQSWKEYKEKIDKKEKEKNENKKIRNLNSLILGDNEKYNMTIKNWINPNLKIKSELLYRLSRDGKEYKTFHNLCDNKGNTLTIFKLNDGNILGGFTTKDWDNCQNWKQDQNAFLFSLTGNVKCITNNNNSYNAIYCNHDRGPYFGAIYFTSKKMDEPYIASSHSYYNDSNKLYSGNKGDYYKCEEVEVYKIVIN